MLSGHPIEESRSNGSQRQTPIKDAKVDALNKTVLDQLNPEKIQIQLERKSVLEKIKYTTMQDDRELELFNDPETFMYATKIAGLEFNEHRNATEERELSLLHDPATRPYAERILRLESLEQKTKLEELELNYLLNPFLRPYTDKVFSLLNKQYLSNEEKRMAKLYCNSHTINKADEIFALEQMEELSGAQMIDLTINYLRKLSEVAIGSTDNFQKHYLKVVSTITDCTLSRDYNNNMSPELVKFIAIANSFLFAAKKLTENYFRQVRRTEMSKQTSAATISFFEQKIFENPRIQTLLKDKQVALTLVLVKLFFDNDIQFTQNKLDKIVNHLDQLVIDKKLVFNTSNYKELDKSIKAKLNEMQNISEASQSVNTKRR